MQENDKIQHTFFKNSKLEIDGNLLNRIKGIYKKLKTKFLLNSEILKIFPRIVNKERILAITSFQDSYPVK